MATITSSPRRDLAGSFARTVSLASGTGLRARRTSESGSGRAARTSELGTSATVAPMPSARAATVGTPSCPSFGVGTPLRLDSGRHSLAGSPCVAACSACAAAPADGYRCAGCFASARRITCSISTGRSVRHTRGGGGASSRCARISSNSVAFSNGVWPVSASYSTTPAA